jgi:molecular chaperone GrpE
MQDRTKEPDTAPTLGDAANNNLDERVGAASGPETEEPALEADVAVLESELADLKDRLLRALAETENVRRRAHREREDASKFAVAGFAKELLSVADNLRRALDSLPEAEARDERTRSLLAGVEATERELLRVFERHGIRRIDPKGERFNHNFHEAVFEAERPGHPAGTVIEVLQPGYVLHDRLLRPAMVGVAKESADAAQPLGSADTAA